MTTKIKTSVKRSRFFLSSLVGFLAVSALSMFLPTIQKQQNGSVMDIPQAHADTAASSCGDGGGDGSYSGCNCDGSAGSDGCAGSDGACE